jgi:uncharacterized protein (TIGR03083 family)
MDVAEHIAALRLQGELLVTAAARSDLDTPVSTCPDWRLRDLVRHIGGVHRWAATFVVEARPRPMDEAEQAKVMDTWPTDDGGLVGWFREGHARLVHSLEAAAPDLACWTFLAAPSPLAFWARRQAHETAIHRADAESPAGTIGPFPPAFAADGIDELLSCFLTRPKGRPAADPARILQVHCTDTGDHWLVRIGPDRVEVSREPGDGDCAVHGPASDLYLLLWNRRSPDGLDLRGDCSLLDLWRRSVRIRWT